ncbi:MAG: hypothetical protein E7315_00515 [Clostridiales bacterium]|nr:hypothetical protein [Clostridiales bacterium]
MNKINNDTVRIKLMKDSNENKEPLFVGVNNKTYYISRGVWVDVPKNVAKVIERSLRQDEMTAFLIEETQSDYKKKNS